MTNNFIKRTPQGWLQLDTHRPASDHIAITGIPVPTRHADAQAIASISICASRRQPIEVTLQVGPEDAAGWRNKDGEAAQQRRKEVAEDAAKHLGVDVRAITVQSRYSGHSLVLASMAARREAERKTALQAAEEHGPTHYRVCVEHYDWDSRGSYFKVCGSDTLSIHGSFEAAKQAFAAAWEQREHHASWHSAPVNIILQRVVVGQSPEDAAKEVETYSGEGNPAGDATWECYYGGQDCTGWHVLWAHNVVGSSYRGPKYDGNCLGIIGRQQAQHCGTGEWELRHMDDHSGALYADELFATREEMLACIAGIDELRERQDVLKELSSGNEPVVYAERRYSAGVTEAHATLPHGEEFTVELDFDDESATFHAFSFDREANKDVLVRIELAEVAETEEENA